MHGAGLILTLLVIVTFALAFALTMVAGRDSAAGRSLRQTYALLAEATLRWRDDARWWLAAGLIVFLASTLVERVIVVLTPAGPLRAVAGVGTGFADFVLYAWLVHLAVRALQGASIHRLALDSLDAGRLGRWLPACAILALLAFARYGAFWPLLQGNPSETGAVVFGVGVLVINVLIAPLLLFVLPLTVHGGLGAAGAFWGSARTVARRYLHWVVVLIALRVPYVIVRDLGMFGAYLLPRVGLENVFVYLPEIVSLLPTAVVVPWIVLAITVAYRDAFGVAEEPPAPVE